MKRSQVRITFLGIVIASLLFSGCQQSIPASSAKATRQALMNEVYTAAAQTVIASFPSKTPTPSITPTPTDTPVPTMIPPNLVVSEEILPLVPSSIISKGPSPQPRNAKVSLPTIPGDYLVYLTDSDSLEYISPDGNIKGTLMDENFNPTLIIQGGTSRFVFIRTQSKSMEGPFDTASIWETDVFGNLLNSWKALSGSNICMNPEISPFGNWIGIDCIIATVDQITHQIMPNGRVINLINLRTGDTQSFPIHCDEYTPEVSMAVSFYWSANETEFAYQCPLAESYFISMAGDHVTAKQLGVRPNTFDILTISPDWKHIVIDMGAMPNNPDGTISGHRIMIANLDCVLTNNSECNQGTTFELPSGGPYSQTPVDQMKGMPPSPLDFDWGHSGNTLLWMSYGALGQIDLRTSTNRVTNQGEFDNLVGFSPDDQWMLLFGVDPKAGKHGLFTISTNDNSITHFLSKPDMLGFYTFYGWLTIH